jgi:SAM-dependent methyltransferase
VTGSEATATGAANAHVVVGMYTPIAPDYAQIWAPLLRPYGVRLLEALPLRDASRVLDLGCGVGRLLSEIAARAPSATVVGTDLTEGMLRQAPPGFARVVMDATRPAFATRSFDVVVSAFVVFHFPEPLPALRRIRTLLRPGGSIALAVWGTEKRFPALDAWNEVLDAHDVPPDPAAEGPPDGEDQVNSVRKMRSILRGAGFERIHAESVPWERPWDLDGFVAWRTRLGPSRRRLAQLDDEARTTCITAARERVAAMPAEDLVDHDEVILGSGRAPTEGPGTRRR